MKLLVIIAQILYCHCVTFKRIEENIQTKTKIQLSPREVTCGLNKMVKISVPVINDNSLYRLRKPNGDVIKLHIDASNTAQKQGVVVTKNMNSTKPVLRHYGHKTFSLEDHDVNLEEKNMYSNEFLIGPLLEEDGGNWMLSVYAKDIDNNWIELFQVITLIITETVELNVVKPTLHPGDTFNLSFAYPIKDIESCELIPPSSTFDRYFTRSNIFSETCTYIIPNITRRDQGKWIIQGVKMNTIVYRGKADLKVKQRKLKLDRRKTYSTMMKKYRHHLFYRKVVRSFK